MTFWKRARQNSRLSRCLKGPEPIAYWVQLFGPDFSESSHAGMRDRRISNGKRRRQLLYPSVMWITFAGFRIYPVMEREKYSALARDQPTLDPFFPLHHQWTAWMFSGWSSR